MKLSFDYLVNALRELDDNEYRFKKEISYGRLALGEKQALIQSGLVEHYEKRTQQDSGLGRCKKAYRLTQPYETIRVGQFITDTYPTSAFDRHLFKRLSEIKLVQLDQVTVKNNFNATPRYSAERLINCLDRLYLDRYVPLHPTLYRVTSVARRIMNDMASIGVVDILNEHTRGYKLTQPLTDVPVSILLPYLCSMSANRDYYNRLFYAVKDRPVSLLMMS